jgi:hypothetical protein
MDRFHPFEAIPSTAMNRLSSSLLGAFCASLLLLPSDRLAAQNVRPPTQLTYQGFLTDGNGQPFGNTTPVNKTVVFRIFDALTGGNLKWSSQQVVTVDRGYFSVLLGQGSAFGSEPFNADLTGIFTGNGASDRYLELTADGTVIAPRLRFFPSPYAMLAKSATELLDPTTGTSSLSVDSGNLNVPGAVGIGTGSPVGRFYINEATGTSASSNGGTLVLDHANPGGESSIVFRSNINRGGADYGYINYRDNRTAGGENAVFTIGIQNDGDDHIALLPSGNVGINTTNPGEKLDVVGNAQVSGNVYVNGSWGIGNVSKGLLAAGNDVGLRASASGDIWFQSANGDRTHMFIRNGGGVNIGPNNFDSAGQLNIFESNGNDGRNGTGTITLDHGNGGGHSSIVFRSQNNRGSDFGYIDFEEARSGTSESNVLFIGTKNDGDDHIALMPSGYVGIGTDTPEVPLDVRPTKHRSASTYSANADTANADQGQQNGVDANGLNVSIRSQGYVEMQGVVYFSDRRIKEIVSRKDPLEALKRINQLVLTDYRMVDKVQEGSGLRTGLIAQEVATVFPEAVHSRTNFIPDIYVQASAVTYQTNDQALHVTLAKPHGFAPGNRVRLFDDKGMLETKVVAVANPNQFTVSSTRATSALFVYGREVNDFLAVDYDRLFTTGLGAIQALSKTVDQQAQALRESQARVAELEQKVSRLAGMEGELTEIRKLLARLTAPRTGERAALQVRPEVHPPVAR